MSTDGSCCHSDEQDAFQDYYADDYSHCYGCGRLNEKGLKLKSFWEGEESVCRILPASHYTGGKKDIIYGGLIASLIDCHGAATAAGAKVRELGICVNKGEMPRFVTASLKVNYLAPTPINTELELRGRVKQINGRKITVEVDLLAQQTVCANGELLFIQLKD